LERVAEETQVAADADAPLLDHRQAVVASGRRAGEDALADAVDDGLLQRVATESEKQQADTRSSVGRLVGRQSALDAGLGLAADDGGGVAGRRQSGGARPLRRLGGDDQAGRRHGERFGERVFEGDVVDREHRPLPVAPREDTSLPALPYGRLRAATTPLS